MWESERPALRSPVLVAAFAGWNDAASAATAALEAAAAHLDSQVIAQVDPEEFFDFQVTRPSIRLSEGQARQIDWPGNSLVAVRAPLAERDLVLLSGTEPNLRWRTFSSAILDACQELGVEMMVTLGALIADVAHSRPVPITGLASDPDLVEKPWPQPVELRGADRHRRRSPRPVPRAGDRLGQPVGGRAALRGRGAQPEGGPGAASPPGGADGRRRRGLGA